MNKEDKELLLKDLCARLRYEVKCYPVITNGEPNTIGGYCEVLDDFYIREVGGWFPISMIKPYLRPISSMMEEEKEEYKTISICGEVRESKSHYTDICPTIEGYDWLNAHHFDYRNLIEKGLALQAPEGMYELKRNSL